MALYITGRHVAAARTLAGLSVRDLARAAGIGSASVSRVEAFGANPVAHSITDAILEAIAVALDRSGVVIREDGVLISDPNRWVRSVNRAVAERRARHAMRF